MDNLDGLRYYQMSLKLWDLCWSDVETMMKDIRGREITKQMIRAVGSISANIEEGYGKGTTKEYSRSLKIARGSSREARGWYIKSKYLMDKNLIDDRCQALDKISAMLTKAIHTLENNSRK